MFFFVIIIFLILILFIPIPLKFKLHYSKDMYYIKFYNINIISHDDGMLKIFLDKKKKKEKNIKDSKTKSSKFKDCIDIDSKKKNLKPLIKTIYITLKKNKFKPSIKFSSDIIYSLGDASKTAICLGLFYNINPILIYIFSILFKVKLLKNNFKPIFKDEILFEFTISSIITFNLAQIIYIFFIIYKSIHKNRR